MLNPVNHTRSAAEVGRYGGEPYVLAGDVHAHADHAGKAGWTWYTGSAGWMYRLVVESLLGLRLEADQLHIAPCLPAHWDGFKLHYRYRETAYHIAVSQTRAGTDGVCGMTSMTVDGLAQNGQAIFLSDDHREHTVEVSVQDRRAIID
jgi:cellobiose phosphorylase